MKERTFLTLDEAEAVMKALALLHSTSLFLEEKDPIKLQLLKNSLKITYQENGWFETEKNIHYLLMLKILRRKYNANPNSDIYKRLDETFTSITNITGQKTPRKHFAFTHGDLWGKNILFKRKRNVLRAIFVDFQRMAFISVGHDIATFLYMNMRTMDLEQHFDGLLDVYLLTLQENLVKLGLDSTESYSKPWLEFEVNQYHLQGFLAGLRAVALQHPYTRTLPVQDETYHKSLDGFLWPRIDSAYAGRVLELVNFYYSRIHAQ